MEWIPLNDTIQLDALNTESYTRPDVIFKHSTRCSISHMAKARLDRENTPSTLPFYYLDLIQFRSISNDIAERFQVHHESPQVLLIFKCECVYDQSHNGIYFQEILEEASRFN